MKYFSFFVIFLCALVTNVMTRKCPIACTREFNPTCGFNGSCYRKFGSPCFIEHYNCENGEKFQVVSPGECVNAKLRCPEKDNDYY